MKVLKSSYLCGYNLLQFIFWSSVLVRTSYYYAKQGNVGDKLHGSNLVYRRVAPLVGMNSGQVISCNCQVRHEFVLRVVKVKGGVKIAPPFCTLVQKPRRAWQYLR